MGFGKLKHQLWTVHLQLICLLLFQSHAPVSVHAISYPLSFTHRPDALPSWLQLESSPSWTASGHYYTNLPHLWSLVSCPQDDNLLGFEPDECIGNTHIDQGYTLSITAWVQILIWNLSKILAILPLLGDVTKLLLRINIKLSYRIICKCYPI